MKNPTKPFQDYSQLVERLIDLGMKVDDRKKAEKAFRCFGYHRLGGYRYIFRQLLPKEEQNESTRKFRRDNFINGTNFNDVMKYYEFDAELRQILLNGLFDFEIRFKAAIAHILAKRNPMAHLDKNHLDKNECDKKTNRRNNKTKFEAWKSEYEKALNRSKDEDFIIHHINTYSKEKLPVWATVELLSFGNLPHLFSLLKQPDQNAVARYFGIKNGSNLFKWSLALSNLRNNCAHNIRVFNKNVKYKIKINSSTIINNELLTHIVEENASDIKIYRHCAVLAYLLLSHENGTTWNLKLTKHVNNFPLIYLDEKIPITSSESSMGFPKQWQKLKIWNVS